MKHKLLTISRLLSITLILLLTMASGTALLSGCNSKADAAKKNKVEKNKAREALEDEVESEEDEKNEETNSENSTKKTGEKDSEKSVKTEKEESNSDKQSSEKKGEQHSKHGEKVKSEKETAAAAERIWKDLLEGNERYVGGKHTNARYVSIRKQLMKEQKPEVIILGCADSRVPPELVFDKNLGELFVIRAAGNITDLISLGSIEYAVEHLHSKVLVILGHESCGAVAAAVSNEEMPTRNLSAIINKIIPAFEDSKSCPLGGKMNNSCVELNVEQSAKDVLMNSPIIKKAVKEGELTIIRAVYQLESGKVIRLE